MKNLFYLLLMTIIFTWSCGPSEAPLLEFIATINNQSSQELTIEAYLENDLIFENRLEQNESSDSCKYALEKFLGYKCELDSMVFKFPNGKGYISNNLNFLTPKGQFDFPDKSPFLNEGYINTESNIYRFKVTEEDYNNAFDID